MKWIDLIKLSLDNLRHRKLRTALTLLGVIIGTASIVTMLSIALGQSKAMMDMIDESAELTTINVWSNNDYAMYYDSNQYNQTSQDESLKLNAETIKYFKSIPHVQYVSPVLNLSLHLQQGVYENYVELQGLTVEALEAKDLFIVDGEMPDFTKTGSDIPMLIGRDLANNFWNPNSQNYSPAEVDLINQNSFMTIENYNLSDSNLEKPKKYLIKVAGIMGTEDEYSWTSDLYSAYTEIGHLENFLNMNYRGKAWPGQASTKTGKPMGEIIYNSAIIGTEDIKYTKDILNQLRDQGFSVDSNIEYIDSMRKQSVTQELVLGGIGGIALFVAAIGIANTMMMSVYERTKEIGIFKVLGCDLASIRNMFLTEAALIGLFGGIIGIGLSEIISYILNAFSDNMMMGMGSTKISIIPIWLMIGAVLFAMLIGIIAGVLPARRAMKLSALEAIRNE